MPLDSIAHYRLGPKLGEGGMGEVYQATDTKLQREVALKLLPEALTEDPETLERFRREARSLATLSHPNIGAIHGIEESDGRVALVLELIPGDTLADRIVEGSLERNDIFRVAEQVAAALEAAHDHGIVHRDLKPANIKITPDGTAKVLDFGLAKSTEHEPRQGVAESPTIMMTAAQPGMVMGTAPYMSPEQAKGAPVDRRADIWAYGAVMFEMLTGQRLFEGDDVTEVLAAVISREPDLSRLPSDTPPWLRDLIERCLRRDLAMRLPHMGAARIAMVEADHAVDDEVAAAVEASSGLGWVAVAITLAGGLALGAYGSRFFDSPAPVAVPTSTYSEFVFDPPPLPDATPAVSPDGRTIVYAGRDRSNARLLYVRRLDDGSTTSMPGTEFASSPAFSPDGQSVAFSAAGRVKTARLGGGQPAQVAFVSGGIEGMVWTADDELIFAALGTPHLLRVPVAGGVPEVVEVAGLPPNTWISEPTALPDSNLLLVSVDVEQGGSPTVAALDPDQGILTEIVSGISARFVSPSTLVFLQRGSLVAAPFDPVGLRVTGPERSIAPVGAELVTASSTTGQQLIAYVGIDGQALFPMAAPAAREIVWVDEAGNETSTGIVVNLGAEQVVGANGSVGVSLSPDEKRVTWIGPDPTVVALDDITQRRLLPRPGTTTAYARWHPGGEDIFVLANPTGDFRGYLVKAIGGESPREFTSLSQSIPTSFLPDGQTAIGYVITGDNGRDLWQFPLDGEPSPLLETPANERAAAVSPDGRAIVYVTDASGEDRIELRLYPDVQGQAWPISDVASSAPVWARDGKTIFYLAENSMMAVPIDLEDGVRIGTARPLFSASAYEEDQFGNSLYDVASDGRFLMVRLGLGPSTWRWIQNWSVDLESTLGSAE